MNHPKPSNACPIYLLDGGLGTTLEDNYACKFDSSTPLWSSQLLLNDPTTLLAAQTAFARAGADIILTATYQCSFEGFARSDATPQEAARHMRKAVWIARSAFGSRKSRGRVALSLGAYGATMLPSQEYTGKYDPDHLTREGLREWHMRRVEPFFVPGWAEEQARVDEVWANIDMIAFETLPLVQEVLAVREVMGVVWEWGERKGLARMEFWISCVFPGEGNCLPDGSSVKDVVQAMLGDREKMEWGVPMGVGINCTKVGKIESLILEFEQEVKELVEKRDIEEWPSLVVYPDGTDGEVYNTTTKVWEKVGESGKDEMSWDETMMGIVERARQRGLWKSILMGGCCKTTPDDVAKLRKRIDEK